MSDRNIPTEPVMSTYIEKWSKVNVVAHEQERSAREEYSRDCIDWQRCEINRLMTGIEDICQHRSTPPNVRARLRHMVSGIDWRKVRE